MSNREKEPARHYMEPMDRLVAIDLESPLIKAPAREGGETRGRFVDRDDFTFLLDMAAKGIESMTSTSKKEEQTR